MPLSPSGALPIAMRLLALTFATLIVLLQWPLWVGKGSWLKVWQIEAQLATQQKKNQTLRTRNEALDAEVRDLKTGSDAIEERARNELGLIRPEEVFFQVLNRPGSSAPSAPASAVSPSATPSQTTRSPATSAPGTPSSSLGSPTQPGAAPVPRRQ